MKNCNDFGKIYQAKVDHMLSSVINVITVDIVIVVIYHLN